MGFDQPRPTFDTIIVRCGGEIGIKAAWTRRMYERRLIANMKAVLKQEGIPHVVLTRRFGRLYVKTQDAENASMKLAKVFGVASVSPSLQLNSELMEIVKRSVQLADSTFKKGSSFAVNCRRVGKHPYTSQEVCREVGGQMLHQLSTKDLHVNLRNPEATLNIEIREDNAYIYIHQIQGAGGLPLGVQPKLVCLLKSDLNSLVACWMTMKRGCPPVLLHFDETPFARARMSSTLKTAEVLFKWAAGFPRKVYVVSHGPNLALIKRRCAEKLTHVLSKRMMYRVAQKIAEMRSAQGVVTGEVINRNATETLHILSLQDEATRPFPIYRPLIGLEAFEIEGLAQKIGFHGLLQIEEREESERGRQSLGGVLLEDVKAAEVELDTDEMIDETIKSLKIMSV